MLKEKLLRYLVVKRAARPPPNFPNYSLNLTVSIISWQIKIGRKNLIRIRGTALLGKVYW